MVHLLGSWLMDVLAEKDEFSMEKLKAQTDRGRSMSAEAKRTCSRMKTSETKWGEGGRS
jgi:hypothetical protein